MPGSGSDVQPFSDSSGRFDVARSAIYVRLFENLAPVARDGKGVTRTVTEVKVRKGETIDKAIRRLKKKLDREGILRELRARRHYEKPSEQRRRKAARARSRAAAAAAGE